MKRQAELGHGHPSHHLSDEMLLDYASGACDEATALLVATHLTLCPECRKRAETADAIGGTLMASIEPTDVSDDALEQLMARLDEPEEEKAPASAANDEPGSTVLPRVLQKYAGKDLDAIAWKNIGMGVATAELPVSKGSRAFMLRVPAGKAVPQHTHDGNEYVVILQGGYTDEIGHFERGDVAIGDSETVHRPVADPGEDCICLAVADEPIKLTGLLGAILNRFVRI